MSTPRTLKPLFRAGSNLLVDRLVVSRSTARVAQAPTKLLTRPSPSSPSSPSSLICLQCRYSSGVGVSPKRQLRYYSTSQPPDNDPNTRGGDPTQHPNTPSSSSPTPPEPPSLEEFAQAYQRQHEEPPAASPSPLPPNPQQPPDPDPDPDPNAPDPSLPSAQNSRRSPLNRSLSSFMDRAQTTLFAASQRINDLTGYSGIETLKSQISTLESALAAAQSRLVSSRAAYQAAVADRSATQREVTTLLARQKTWTPADFERFTGLYRQDYELEASVARTADELADAERGAERLGRELSTGILARYHEEQIWSDKIRRMSTWGTWGLMGVNVLLFLVFQFGAEPWRRARLVRGFEQKVREALEEERTRNDERFVSVGGGGGGDVGAEAVGRKSRTIATTRGVDESGEQIAAAAAAAAADEAVPVMVDAVESEPAGSSTTIITTESEPAYIPEGPPTTSWRQTLADPGRWKAALVDLSSEREVALRMRDVSLIALEGVVAGAAVAGTVAVFLVRRT